AYAYAWRAVGPSNSRRWRWGLSRTTTWILAAATLGALAIPVPMSTLAPAKIVAKDPLIVSAPIDGVIAEILVLPNTVVSEGQVLFKYEDTTFRSEYEISERNLDVAMAQYRRAAQGSFVEAAQKAEVPLLKAEVELRETERNYAHERLTKVEVKAEQAGLLLYTDKSDWIGKPVVVGQRIMELANPQQLEVRIDLAVADAIVLHEGAAVTLFLNANPFSSVPATVSHASYHAEVLPNNTLAYRSAGPRIKFFRVGAADRRRWSCRRSMPTRPVAPPRRISTTFCGSCIGTILCGNRRRGATEPMRPKQKPFGHSG
ncbi:MAG: HlyD family efflux transporter periplasmic adaptor subunit, partial [Nitrospirae bacterium]|nr:HlyD family efflux transporter periplasmic adaptor subunit [Nitrospirota bacterium]